VHLLLTSIGTAGDLHPFIAIGVALRSRGHDVTILANPHFADRIHRMGLGFWPLGTEDDHHRMVTGADLVSRARGPSYVLRNLILANFEPMLDALQHLARVSRPDAVLAHHICFAAPAACQRLGIPCATAVLAPLFWLSRHEPIVYPHLPIENLPRWADRALRHLLRPAARWLVDKPTNAVRRAHGLPDIRNIAFHEARGQTLPRGSRRPSPGRPILALWSSHYRPALPDDPPNARICGFTWFDRAGPIVEAEDRRLRDFLSRGEPPLVFTLGTSVVHHGQSLYPLAAAACRELGRRAILLGAPDDGATPDSDRIHRLSYAPYSRILPHAAAVIHHGGIGTTAHAMRAGAPSLIIPFANDEFDNAARAKRLGVAHTLPVTRLNHRTLTEAIRRLLADKPAAAAAKVISTKLIAEDGADAAAEALTLFAARGMVARLQRA
jgi:UDP:flavonoid glycosyltransferase YjiC (YdhE family)